MYDWKQRGALTLTALLTTALLVGCAGNPSPQMTPVALPTVAVQETPAAIEPVVPDNQSNDNSSSNVGDQNQTSSGENTLDEYGTYSSAEDVALYLHTYGELPDNFITKNEARDLGWSGGGLEDYAPGMCIGGDTFGNREGILPKGKYHECDINTLGENSRGAERIVWDDAGNIYYTNDHYESFELLYEGE